MAALPHVPLLPILLALFLLLHLPAPSLSSPAASAAASAAASSVASGSGSATSSPASAADPPLTVSDFGEIPGDHKGSEVFSARGFASGLAASDRARRGVGPCGGTRRSAVGALFAGGRPGPGDLARHIAAIQGAERSLEATLRSLAVAPGGSRAVVEAPVVVCAPPEDCCGGEAGEAGDGREGAAAGLEKASTDNTWTGADPSTTRQGEVDEAAWNFTSPAKSQLDDLMVNLGVTPTLFLNKTARTPVTTPPYRGLYPLDEATTTTTTTPPTPCPLRMDPVAIGFEGPALPVDCKGRFVPGYLPSNVTGLLAKGLGELQKSMGDQPALAVS